MEVCAPQDWEGRLRALRFPDVKCTLSLLTPDPSPLIPTYFLLLHTHQDPDAPAFITCVSRCSMITLSFYVYLFGLVTLLL